MDEVIFYVLDIYHNKTRDNCIDLYGKCEDGKSVCIHVLGFRDYFRVGKNAVATRFPTPKSVFDALQLGGINVDAVTEIEMQTLYFYDGGRALPMYDIRLSCPSQRKAALEIVVGNTTHALYDEWQRAYVEKFCTDMRVEPCNWLGVRDVTLKPAKHTRCDFEGVLLSPVMGTTFYAAPKEDVPVDQVILGFDLECANLRSDFQMAKAAFDPIIQISVAVAHLLPVFTTGEQIVFCFRDTAQISRDGGGGGPNIQSFRSEHDMLRAFLDHVKSTNPDAITGYNITGFDLPYLWTRCEMLNLDIAAVFSRDEKVAASLRLYKFHSDQMGKRESYKIISPGILVCDCLVLVRDFLMLKLDSYTLNSVAGSLLGNDGKKEDMPYEEIPRIFKKGDPTELARLASYCMKDTMLVMDILQATDGIFSLSQEAKIVGLDRSEVLRHAQQRMCVSTICNQIRDDGDRFALPAHVRPYMKTDKYEGAVVLTPKSGLYEDKVVVFDFASMYPSVICAHNICYSTMTTDAEICKMGWIEGKDYHKAPGIANGLFVTPEHRKSLLAKIIERLSAHRKQAKRVMALNEPGSIRYVMADCRQQAYKRTSNSLYGLCGANQGALLPSVTIASSVTAFSRDLLSRITVMAERMIAPKNGYPRQATVIYGDTDSIFVSVGNMSLDSAMRLGADISRKITEELATPPVSLEFEKVFSRMILMGKKNYVGYMHMPDGKKKLLMKGLAAIKRDRPLVIREMVVEAIRLAIELNDWPAAANLIRERTTKIATDGGKCTLFSAWDFSKTVAINKHRDEYAGNPPVHFNVAEKMWEDGDPDAPAMGDRLSFVICKGDSTKVSARGRHPKHVVADPDTYIDTHYYLNQIQDVVVACFQYMYPGGVKDLKRDLFSAKVIRPKTRFVAPPPKQNLITRYLR